MKDEGKRMKDEVFGIGDHGVVSGGRRQGRGEWADTPGSLRVPGLVGKDEGGRMKDEVCLDRARVLHADCEKGPRSPVMLPGMVIGVLGARLLTEFVLAAEGSDEERVAVFFGAGCLVRNTIRGYVWEWSDRDVDDLAVDVAWRALMMDGEKRKSNEVLGLNSLVCEGRR
jgi:hypothetical protein